MDHHLRPEHQDHADPGERQSARTVVVALLANLAIALAKSIAALLTRSASLTTEAAHSFADSLNEVFLYIGVASSTRASNERHPLGYGQARYFWSLLAGAGIFVIGGAVGVAEGVANLLHPEPLQHVPIGIAVLVVSAVLEVVSWRTAYRELNSNGPVHPFRILGHLRTTSNPTPATVFLEDSAAILGLALAIAALVLHVVTGSATPDAIASILIGLLLLALAWSLIRRNTTLLIDEAAPADVEEELTELIEAQPWILRLVSLTTIWTGAEELLVLLDVVPVPGSDVPQESDRLREKLLGIPFVRRVAITPTQQIAGLGSVVT